VTCGGEESDAFQGGGNRDGSSKDLLKKQYPVPSTLWTGNSQKIFVFGAKKEGRAEGGIP